jgi:hypothetical protein
MRPLGRRTQQYSPPGSTPAGCILEQVIDSRVAGR